MIKITNTETFGWEAAIRGMRNPKNSWDKSDSGYEIDETSVVEFRVGKNDLTLMKTLSNAGTDHGKYLRYITVQLDITAPLYWWKEFKTYRRGRKFMDDGDEFLDPEELEMFIETNSCSTMHKIHDKQFTLDDFSCEHLVGMTTPGYADTMIPMQSTLDKHTNWFTPQFVLEEVIIKALNRNREMFLETKDKTYWWQMIQLLPSSYNQKRTVQLNYQVLKSMYHARKHHKLDEWRDFCSWIETLPYSEIITGESNHA